MKREAVDARKILELRGLPASPSIERLVLGSVLVDGAGRFEILRGALDESHFSLESHRRIWAALGKLHEAGLSLDGVSLAGQMQQDGTLDSVGGLATLVDLDAGMPHGISFDGWVRTLQEKATLRDAINRLNDAMVRCLQEDSDALEAAYGVAEAISARTANHSAPRSAADIIDSIGIQEFCQPTRMRRGVTPPAKWGRFREQVPVFRDGQLIIVAALTSAGKSTFTAQIALEAALEGTPAAMFSMEMGADEILPRLASRMSRVDGYAHLAARMRPEERTAFQAATTKLREIPLFVDDRSTHTILSIASAVRRMSVKPRLLVVDYLQLMQAAGNAENRVQAVSEMSRGLKRLAGDLGIPVIALSQLSRKSAQEDRRPELHDLRDSGSIEQDANVVIFLHITRQNSSLPESPCEVIIAKNRGGRKGVVPMLFRKPIAEFVED